MKKQFRIKKNETIKSILNNRDSVRDGYFNVYKKKNGLPHFRYALSVGRKFGKAVQRNRVKRRVREVIRHANIEGDYDIFIIVYPKAENLNYDQIETRLKKLFRRHKLI